MPKYKVQLDTLDLNTAQFDHMSLSSKLLKLGGTVIYSSFSMSTKAIVFIVVLPVRLIGIGGFPKAKIEECDD